jgi:hypothetical protein
LSFSKACKASSNWLLTSYADFLTADTDFPSFAANSLRNSESSSSSSEYSGKSSQEFYELLCSNICHLTAISTIYSILAESKSYINQQQNQKQGKDFVKSD